jgi:MFS family permease
MEVGAIARQNPANRRDDRSGALMVAALFTTLFLTWGPVNASSVFFLPVVKHFGWSRAFFSLLVSTAPLAAGLSSPAIGWLMDRFGARRIMIVGAAMVGLSFIGLSLADSAGAFFGIFIVLGVGITASTVIPAVLVITKRFRDRRGKALGIVFAGIPLGGMAVTVFADEAVRWGGFRSGYLAMAIPILVVVIPLIAAFVRSGNDAEQAAAAQAAQQSVLAGLEVKEALQSRSFWMIAIAEVMFAVAGVGLRVHLVPMLTGIGYSSTLAAEILSATFLFNAIGTFAIGPVADRFGGAVTLSMVFVGAAGGIAALLGAASPIAVAGFVLLFGLMGETPAAVFPLAVTESLGLKRLGSLLGLMALSRTIGFAAGPVIAGHIFDRSGSYTGALVTFVVLELISMVAMRAVKPLRTAETSQHIYPKRVAAPAEAG